MDHMHPIMLIRILVLEQRHDSTIVLPRLYRPTQIGTIGLQAEKKITLESRSSPAERTTSKHELVQNVKSTLPN